MSIPFQFGKHFQEQAVVYCFRNLAFAKKFLQHIPLDELPTAHKFLLECIEKNIKAEGKIPNSLQIEDELKKIEPIHREAYRNTYQRLSGLVIEDSDFLKRELSEYAKKIKFFKIHLASEVKWNLGQFEEAYTLNSKGMAELFGISFRDDEIIPFEGFVDYLTTHKNQEGGERVATGIPTLDEIMNGGLAKGELGIILGSPKMGKSLTLLHMAIQGLIQGKFVGYFLLEGTTEAAIARFLSRLSGIPYRKVNSGNLTIEEGKVLQNIKKKYFHRLFLVPINSHWSYTVGDIEAKISELEAKGINLDLAVIDYADLLTDPSKKEKRFEQTQIFRDIKRLAVIRKLPIWTASQANRPSKDDKKVFSSVLKAESISESYEKVRVCDILLTLNQTSQERENGVMRFHLDLYRSGEGDKTIQLLTDFSRMIFFSKKYGELDHREFAWQKKRRGKK